jgi:hypothetical protein
MKAAMKYIFCESVFNIVFEGNIKKNTCSVCICLRKIIDRRYIVYKYMPRCLCLYKCIYVYVCIFKLESAPSRTVGKQWESEPKALSHLCLNDALEASL